MNSKQLVKVVKALVEAEVAKKQELFLKKTFPKILEEEIKKRMGNTPTQQSTDVDAFSLANAVLEEDRKQQEVEQQTYTKNPVLNQILNETAMGSVNQMDKTMTFGTHNVTAAQGQTPIGTNGVESFRQEMTAKMGFNTPASQPQKTGLGVQTGLAGLDRILNRDNSELVKAMSRNKVGA